MKPIPLILSVLAALATGNALAAEGDEGRQLAYTCTGCHGIPGYKNVYPHYHVPRIAGQTREYLVAALRAYQSGERAHPTMRAQGESLSEAEIEQIATFLANHGSARR